MEIVSVKFQEDILKNIDKAIEKHNFNSRTEFIRESVRDKLASLSKEELIKEFFKLKGSSKIKTSPEEEKKIRIEVGNEMMKELDKRFKLNPQA